MDDQRIGSRGRIPLQGEADALGQFIGDWEMDARYPQPDGTEFKEIHFGWILDGTAVQDTVTGVIENPPPGFPKTGFGTMVRFYDPTIDAWQSAWVAPLGRVIQTFVARQVGDEIVLEGKNKEGYVER